MKYCRYLILLTGFWVNFVFADISSDPQVKSFIQEMVEKHDFDKTALTKVFKQVNFQNRTVNAMNKPYEAKPWYLYQKHFVTQSRIDDGVIFWKKHAKALARAQKTYHVPAEMIVAIIGIESHYGQQRGQFKVIDALSTLAFQYPKRAPYFRNELSQFLLLSRENHLDPLALKGSYAGAMGQPQFMPSSYRAYAVDFTGDGSRDLMNNVDDIIGSVANYFQAHGWKDKQPIATQVTLQNKKAATLFANNKKPNITVAALKKKGVIIPKKYSANEKVIPITLQTQTNTQYWLGFNNFYAIMRYNSSALYAMAAYQLSEKIKVQYNKKNHLHLPGDKQ